jgi:hypothetical protein
MSPQKDKRTYSARTFTQDLGQALKAYFPHTNLYATQDESLPKGVPKSFTNFIL